MGGKHSFGTPLGLSATLLCLWLVIYKRNHRLSNHKAIPRPTPYPLSFTIQFDTNVTRQSTSNITEHPLRSTLYYDWTLPAQRVDHPAGAYECVRFYNVTRHGCSLYFLAKGMYRVIITADEAASSYHDTLEPCCLDIPGIGPPPPDWAHRANPNFHGLVHDAYSGLEAYEFVFDHQHAGGGVKTKNTGDIYDMYHTTREVHDGTSANGLPLVFTFPSKAKGIQDYHFDPTSLVVGHPEQELFQLPEGCVNVKCKETRTNVERQAMHLHDV
jgi:hypothetical protein